MNNSELIEKSLLKGGVHTEREIWGQPDLWQKVYEKVRNEKEPLSVFLAKATSDENLNVILTGAGSSAFIGLSLIGTFKQNLKRQIAAVATTDLVTHPNDFFYSDKPLLLISFALKVLLQFAWQTRFVQKFFILSSLAMPRAILQSTLLILQATNLLCRLKPTIKAWQ